MEVKTYVIFEVISSKRLFGLKYAQSSIIAEIVILNCKKMAWLFFSEVSSEKLLVFDTLLVFELRRDAMSSCIELADNVTLRIVPRLDDCRRVCCGCGCRVGIIEGPNGWLVGIPVGIVGCRDG